MLLLELLVFLLLALIFNLLLCLLLLLLVLLLEALAFLLLFLLQFLLFLLELGITGILRPLGAVRVDSAWPVLVWITRRRPVWLSRGRAVLADARILLRRRLIG